MRGWLIVVVAALAASSAVAQPADCPRRPAQGASGWASIDLSGQPGVPAGTKGKLGFAVPLEAPETDCGEPPPPPRDVLEGEPGDLLRGTPAPVR